MSFYGFCKAAFGGLFRLLYRVRVVGAEREPTDRPYLACANHSSYIDPVLLAVSLRQKQRFIAKQTLTNHFHMRVVFSVFDVLTVSRDGNNLSTFRAAIRTLKEGGCIALFPQGTRMPGVNPDPSQAMAGMMMIAGGAKADILPVSILTDSRKPRLFRKTTVIIGEAIPFSVYRGMEQEKGRDGAASYCFEKVCAPFREPLP